MRLFKIVVLFSMAFVLAWIILATFTQTAFKQPVAAVILWYQTPALPIFWYVAGAAGLGIAIGALCLVSPLINAWAKLRNAHKKINQLESAVAPTPIFPETDPDKDDSL